MSKPESRPDMPDGVVNLRDLAGLPTENGVLTRPGVLYRSDAPHFGDRVPDITSTWPPAAVVDLRDPDESRSNHPMSEISTVYRISLLEEMRTRQRTTREWLSLEDLYLHMVTDVPKKMVEVFRIVVETDGPVLIHCAAGKDRTGVVSAMLLGAVGVRTDSIVADYVRTDRNMFQVLRRLGEEPQLPPGVDEEAVRELMSTPTEAIEGVLDYFAGHEQGVIGWLRSHDVTTEEIERWREKFLAGPI